MARAMRLELPAMTAEQFQKMRDRFYSRVPEPNAAGCREWTGTIAQNGYGMFSIQNSFWLASRVMWLLEVGTFGERDFVCHRCDNPPCVELSHLFVGTHADNMADMVSKGRSPRLVGALSGMAKLAESDVVDARRRRSTGATVEALAAHFGVDCGHMSRVLSGECWPDSPMYPAPPPRGLDKDEIVRLYQSGLSTREVAEQVGCDSSHVSRTLAACGVPVRQLGSSRRVKVDEAEVLRLFLSGVRPNAIADQMGCSNGPIRRILREAGLPPHRAGNPRLMSKARS